MSVHNELEYFQITYNRGSALYYLKNELGYDLINCWSLSMLDEVEKELFELYFWFLERYSKNGNINEGYKFLVEKTREYYSDLK